MTVKTGCRRRHYLVWLWKPWWVRAWLVFALLFQISVDAALAATSGNASQVIHVVMDDNYPPYSFRDTDGVLQGITVDQWRVWQQHSGVRAELHGMEWQEALRRMRAGEFDVIDTIFSTPDRELEFDFSRPYARLAVPIFFNASLSGITDVRSLNGFAVAAKTGDASVDTLRAAGVENLHLYANYEAIITAARDGKVNVFLIDEPPALYYLNKYGISERFRRGESINTGEFHRAVRKGNRSLLELVERGFADLSTQELQQINSKWFGNRLATNGNGNLRYVIYGVVAGVGILLGLMLWNMTLSRLVARRTAQLRTSESRWRSILEAEPEGVLLLSPESELLESNAAGLQMLQAGSLQQAQQQRFEDYVVETQRDDLRQLLDRTLKSRSDHCEVEIQGLQGAKIWLSLHAARLTMSDEERPAVVLVVHNITDRKRADALMRGQVQVLEQMAAGAPMNATLELLARVIEAQSDDLTCSILLLDRTSMQLRHAAAPNLPADMTQAIDGLPIGPNQGSCGTAAYLGRDVFVGDIATDPLWTNYRHLALPNGYRACWSTPVFDAAHHVLGTFAIYYRHACLPTPEHIRLIETAGRFATVCINHYRAEQALRDSEARFRQVIENIDEVFWIRDSDSGKILYVSPSYEAIFGRSCSSLYAAPSSWLESVVPEDRERVQAAARTQTSGAYEVEFRIERADGVRRRIYSRAFPILDQSNRPFRVAGFARDVTEARNLAEHMRQAQKMEAIGTLAGGIAHDFNNILGVINGNAELALRDVAPDHAVVRQLQQILKAGQRARSMVQQILLFSRAESTRQEVLDLGPLVKEALEFLHATLPADVELNMAIARDVPFVRADATQIHQVILNLCTNAWHALGEKGGKIDVTLNRLQVASRQIHRNATLAPGEYACLTIRDNGAGMDEQTQQRMFEPFFTTKGQGQGTGLGLSMVQGIARTHGASILVNSELRRGTSISICFPAVANEGAVREVTEARLSEGKGQHILCIDDEDTLVILMTRTLESLGYRVSGFSDPEKALSAFAQNPGQFDLVVTDYNMPGANGLEVARRIMKMRPDVPVVLNSGYVTDELIQQAEQIGVRKVIYKPSTLQEFAASVQQAMEGTEWRPSSPLPEPSFEETSLPAH